MRLQIARIDHARLVRGVFGSQADHNPGEDAVIVAALGAMAFATHLQRFQRL